jgi:hypothetical protein
MKNVYILTAAEVCKAHRLQQDRHQQLVQAGAHQVFPEKQCQPHPEGLFGGVLLLHLLSHHHPQIRLAYLDAETLPGLEKAERDVKDYAHKFVSFLLNIYYKFTKSAKKYSWLIFQKTLKN